MQSLGIRTAQTIREGDSTHREKEKENNNTNQAGIVKVILSYINKSTVI